MWDILLWAMNQYPGKWLNLMQLGEYEDESIKNVNVEVRNKKCFSSALWMKNK